MDKTYKIAANGGIYWQGKYGILFLDHAENKVTLRLRQQVKGEFKTTKWLCFSLRTGKLRVYRWSKRYGVRDVTYSDTECLIYKLAKAARVGGSDSRNLPIALAKQAVAELLQIEKCPNLYETTIAEALPFLQQYDRIPPIPAILRQGLKRENLKDAVKIWFGRDSKQLLKLVARLLETQVEYGRKCLWAVQINWLALAVAFAQQWQLDYIHTLLELKPVEIDPQQMHHLLQQYSPQRALKLLESAAAEEYNSSYLLDAANMYWQMSKELPHYKLPSRPRSLCQLHDWIQRDYNRFRSEREEKRRLPFKKLGKLDGTTVNGFVFVVPRTAQTLIEWGNALNICIGSYADKAIKRHCYLLGVMAEAELKYAIEIDRQGRIVQFSGRRNSRPAAKDRAAVEAFLQPRLEELFLSKSRAIAS
ncbi:PcfJ domain-containing protein [Chroococcidiopsis sp. FACHB-1243]|uniref:PcfJ domain-containing protein n=1 Tax=Chroococcidiopsis sp. [FACHB-1243] TaxID=2692781 RepID=UPI0017842560|nr:PcfJ domain-containing protein [Chroococcidiopsis sp. [FACHB-1243]]MBD2307796.1 PcfJ domain-containing protein [Chroococcidiopsis sp. [FACHB-1243]]